MPERMTIKLSPQSKQILDNLIKAGVIDFRPTLNVIGIGYRKEVGAIFDKQQPRTDGERWPALSEKYAERKKSIWGDRGILVASGALLASMTVEGATGNINIITKTSAIFGTSIYYGIYHDSSEPRSSHLPQRNFSEPSQRRADIWKMQIEKDIIRNFERNGIKIEGSVIAWLEMRKI